jgi:hypothetical protein
MKKQEKKIKEQLKTEEIKKFLKESITKRLNEDEKSVDIKYLFDDRFRANIWKEGKIHKSFFIQANTRCIIKSDPEIK